MIRAVTRSKFRRAATCAALFVSALVMVMPAVYFSFIPAAHAKMRVDVLSIEPAGGGASRKLMIEVAASDQEKALGLMFRTKLADTEGMLFPYGVSQNITMWMRNTYISLDMIFIRADGVIHRIEARTEPLSERIISASGQVSAVLELAGGAAERLGIKAGDRVRHPVFDAAKAP
jgi:uncharacterized protein